jgi:hypothetical protein
MRKLSKYDENKIIENCELKAAKVGKRILFAFFIIHLVVEIHFNYEKFTTETKYRNLIKMDTFWKKHILFILHASQNFIFGITYLTIECIIYSVAYMLGAQYECIAYKLRKISKSNTLADKNRNSEYLRKIIEHHVKTIK